MAKKPSKAEEVRDDEAAPEAEAPAPSRSRRKLFLYGGAALTLVLALGAGSYFFLFHKKEDAAAHEAKPVAKPVFFLDIPDITVNLAGSANRQQYMRVKAVIEAPDQATIESLKPLMPRITDSFQVHLREMRQTDLEGSAGIYRLREELTRRVNISIAPAKINAVLFKEIVVQ